MEADGTRRRTARDARRADGDGPVTDPCTIGTARGTDLPFLREMLYEAAFWRPASSQDRRPPLDAALADPSLARYVAGWGRPGDRALIACAGPRRLGAVWYRLFTEDEPGYGFVDGETPELGIGVLPSERRRGIGGRLLVAALAQAHEDGHRRVSLSVEPDNPAARLYERVGFQRLTAGDGAWVMVASTTGAEEGTRWS